MPPTDRGRSGGGRSRDERRGDCMRAGGVVAAVGGATAVWDAAYVPADAAQMQLELPPVEIVAASPLIGTGIDRNSVPAATHVLTGEDLRRQGPANLLNGLNEQIGVVSADSASGNPFQPTLLYHGFAASPLQGTAQGLAVYVNGMRFNQPFGDTVDWDLIP